MMLQWKLIIGIILCQGCGSLNLEDWNQTGAKSKSTAEGGISSGGMFVIGIEEKQKVFLQEYWFNKQPTYAVYNARSNGIQLKIRMIELGNEADPIQILKEYPQVWDIMPQSMIEIDAKVFYEDCKNIPLCMYELYENNGPDIGWINGPEYIDGVNIPQQDVFVTFGSLQLGGGVQEDMWYQSDFKSLVSGQQFEMSIVVPVNTGDIEFYHPSKTLQESTAKNPNSILESVLIAAESDSARITVEADKTVIHTSVEPDGIERQPFHTIKLRFQAPEVDRRSMTFISGFRCRQSVDQACVSGEDINRGLEIKEKDDC